MARVDAHDGDVLAAHGLGGAQEGAVAAYAHDGLGVDPVFQLALPHGRQAGQLLPQVAVEGALGHELHAAGCQGEQQPLDVFQHLVLVGVA